MLADPLQEKSPLTVHPYRKSQRLGRSVAAAAFGLLTLMLAEPVLAAGAPAPLTPQRARPPMTYVPEPTVTPLLPSPAGTTVGGSRSQPPPSPGNAQTATREFTPIYTAAVPEQAKPAIAAALDRWAAVLRITVPVEVSIDWQALYDMDQERVVGLAGPTALVADYPGAPSTGIFYPAALANQLTGVDQVADATDITIVLADRNDWDYATSGRVASGKASLTSVVLHEVVHGLGFTSAYEVDENGAGRVTSPEGLPSIFDTFVVDSAGRAITALPGGSTTLGSALTQRLLWNGAEGVEADGGSRPVLFTPSPFEPASSIAHLDEVTYPTGDPDSVTTPTITGNEAIYSTGAIAPAMLDDMGWTLEGNPMPAPTNPDSVPALAPVPARVPVGQPLSDPPANSPSVPVGNPAATPDPPVLPMAAAPPAGAPGAQTSDGTLPRTGFPSGAATLAGALAVAIGAAMVRRSQWTRPVSRMAPLP